MMLSTHLLVGMVIAAVTGIVMGRPDTFIVVGALGGIVPDLDMVAEHRRTAHYPVVYSVLAVTGFWLAQVSTPAAGFAVFFAAAAAHCWMDVLGGGKELRPWQRTDSRAIFDHVRGRWITARRLFYTGSDLDAVLGVMAASLFVLLVPQSRFVWLAAASAVVGVVLAVVMPKIAVWIPPEYPTFSAYIKDQLGLYR